MACIAELHPYALSYLHLGVVFMGNEKLDSADSVVHGVEGLIGFIAAAGSLSVAPFCFKLLNVGTVAEHNAAKVRGSLRCVYLPLKTACVEERQQTRVVDVGVGQEHEVDV